MHGARGLMRAVLILLVVTRVTSDVTDGGSGAQDWASLDGGAEGPYAEGGHGESLHRVAPRISGHAAAGSSTGYTPPPPPCPARDVSNGYLSGSSCYDAYPGYTCKEICNSGYWDGSKTNQNVLCVGPNWNKVSIACGTRIPNYCAWPAAPSNGGRGTCSDAGVSATCSYSCLTGYALSPATSTYTCTAGASGGYTNNGVVSPASTPTCQRIYYCATTPTGSVCGNTAGQTLATCTDTTAGVYTCACFAGAQGGGTNTACTDINECASNPCGVGTCTTPTFNSYTCSCPTGYFGGGIRKGCTACTAGCAVCSGTGLTTGNCSMCDYMAGYVLNVPGTQCIPTSACPAGYEADTVQCRGLFCSQPSYSFGVNNTFCATARYNMTAPPICTLTCQLGYEPALSLVQPSIQACSAATNPPSYPNQYTFGCQLKDLCTTNPCGSGGTCRMLAPNTYGCDCITGYSLINLANGPICQLKSNYCEPLVPPPNGAIVGMAFCDGSINQLCNFTCNVGYRAQGFPQRICMNNGNWSGSPVVCAQIQDYCSALPPPANGGITCNTGLGGTCAAQCNPGFTIGGTATRTCQLAGTYDGLPANCTFNTVFCALPAAPGNGSLSTCARGLGGVCTATCNAGFTPSIPTKTCGPLGVFDGPAFACVAIPGYCPPPDEPQIINAVVNFAQCDQTAGGYCAINCAAGYQTITNATTTYLLCAALDHSWTGQALCTQPISGQCTPPTDSINATITDCATGFGGACNFACNPGTVALTPLVRYCQPTLKYSNGPVICAVPANNTCTPSPPTNGFISSPCSTKINGTCRFDCRPGYACSGAPGIGCNPTCVNGTLMYGALRNGSFVDAALSCDLNLTFCPLPAPPAFGALGVCVQTVGGTCNVTCQVGYLPSRDARVCQVTGQYGGAPITCIKNPGFCPTLTVPVNANLGACSQSIGGTCAFTCASGYEVASGSTTRTCTSAASYDGSPLVCTQTVNFCPPLAGTANYTVLQPCNRSIGSQCMFQCAVGFQPNALPVTTCLSSATWTAATMQCIRIVGYCPLPVAGAQQTFASAPTSRLGDVINFQCNAGYSLSGGSTQTCTADTQTTGVWLPAQPTCNGIVGFCASHVPGSIANGQITDCPATTGTVCKVACDRGYVLQIFSGEPVCQADTTFSFSFPSCPLVASYCAQPNLINGYVIQSNCTTSLGGVCNYACLPGYAPVSGTVRICGIDTTFGAPMACVSQTNFCDLPESPVNGTITFIDRDTNGVSQVVCDNGFRPRSTTGSSFTCSVNTDGQPIWVVAVSAGFSLIPDQIAYDPLTFCYLKPDYCPRPADIQFGRIVSCNYTLGGRCQFECDANFTATEGYTTRTCLADSFVSGHFDGRVVQCTTSRVCPDPGLIPNGQPDTQQLTVGVTVHYTCAPGYMLQDLLSEARFCGPQQTWVLPDDFSTPSPQPVCEPIRFAFSQQPVFANAGAPMFPVPTLDLLTPGDRRAPDGFTLTIVARTPGLIFNETLIPSETSQLTVTAVGNKVAYPVVAFERFNGGARGFLTVMAINGLSIMSDFFALVPGKPTTARFTRDPTGAPAGFLFLQSPVVCVYDKYGNPVVDPVNVTLSAVNSNAQEKKPVAIVGVTTNTTAPDGCTSFTFIKILDGGTTFLTAAVVGTEIVVVGVPFVISAPDCPAGTSYLVDGQEAECIACVEGYFSSARAQKECQKCAGDTYSGTGATTCLGCPDGGDCTTGVLQAQSGFWRPDPGSITFYPCLDESACPGGGNGCAQGYDNTSFLCTGCDQSGEARYGRVGQAGCGRCFSPAVSWIMVVGAALLLGGVVVYLVSSANINEYNSDKSLIIKVLLNYLQMAGLCASFIVQSRTLIGNVLSVASASSVSINLFPVACLFEPSYFDSFILYLTLPAVCMVVTPLFYSLRFWWRSHKRTDEKVIRAIKKQHKDSASAAITVLLFLIYPTVTTECMRMFQCRQYDAARLVSDLTVTCYSPQHIKYLIPAVFGVLIWGLGIPLAGFGILFRQRNKLGDTTVINRFGLMFAGYKPAAYWWEFGLIMARKTMVVVILVFIANPIAQAVCGVFLVMITLLLQVWYQPFTKPKINRLESMSLTIVTGTLLFSALYGVASLDAGQVAVVTVFLILANITCLLVLVVALITSVPAVQKCYRTYILPRLLPGGVSPSSTASSTTTGTTGATSTPATPAAPSPAVPNVLVTMVDEDELDMDLCATDGVQMETMDEAAFDRALDRRSMDLRVPGAGATGGDEASDSRPVSWDDTAKEFA